MTKLPEETLKKKEKQNKQFGLIIVHFTMWSNLCVSPPTGLLQLARVGHFWGLQKDA